MNNAFFFILLIAFVSTSLGQTGKACKCDKSITFKYLISQNSVSGEQNLEHRSREIWVFLDPRAFSEANLRLLFDHLGKKYSEPYDLQVWVRTSWDDVGNPDLDCRGDGESGGPGASNVDKNHWAIYVRNKEVELFRYNPRLNDVAVRSVVLRGKDIGQR